MADISTQIQAIENAVYGEQVRGSIVTALEAMNGQAEVAEAWATGGSGGTASATNNAEYWAEQAATSAATFVTDDTLSVSGAAADAAAVGARFAATDADIEDCTEGIAAIAGVDGAIIGGYQLLGYLIADGSTIFDTGIIPDNAHVYEYTVEQASGFLFGYYTSSTRRIHISDTSVAWGSVVDNTGALAFAFGKKSAFGMSATETQVDGVTVLDYSNTNTESTRTMWFGGRYSYTSGASTAYAPSGTKIYGFRILNNGTLIYNAVPCLRVSDGAVGVLDTVSGVFALPDSGSPGAGPVVSVMDNFNQISDLQATVAGKQNALTFDATPTANSTNPVTSGGVYDALEDLEEIITYEADLDWASIFGTTDYPLGWRNGYYNSSGASSHSSSVGALRTAGTGYYQAKAQDTSLTASAPSGKYIRISEYDSSGTFVRNIGDLSSGSNTQTVAPTAGYRYRFCMGGWTNEAAAIEDLTEEFIDTVTLTVQRRGMEEIDAEIDALDERITALEAGAEDAEDALPDYYDEDGYLTGRLNAITAIQNSLSANNDGFLFVTDYHHRTNAGNSLALLKTISRKTGISKLFFAGDAGGRLGTTTTAYYSAMQQSAEVWRRLSDTSEEFYGSLGNHEWIDGSVFGTGMVLSAYLNRFKTRGVTMDAATGSFWVDNPVNKIRFFFLQGTSGAAPQGSVWFGRQLEAIPSGYHVAVITHHGYIPGEATYAEYDKLIDTSGSSHQVAHRISAILGAFDRHETITRTIAGESTTFDFTQGDGRAIGIFCGHYHHGTLYEKYATYTYDGVSGSNEDQVIVFRGSTDSLQAASIAEDGTPWYWENGIIGGTKVVRSSGTVTEQCIYAIQIDLDAEMIYITAIGGDHDWTASFAVQS